MVHRTIAVGIAYNLKKYLKFNEEHTKSGMESLKVSSFFKSP